MKIQELLCQGFTVKLTGFIEMIYVRYEYNCDICGDAIRQPDEYSFISGEYAPLPYVVNKLGQYNVCDYCLEQFQLKIKDIFPYMP